MSERVGHPRHMGIKAALRNQGTPRQCRKKEAEWKPEQTAFQHRRDRRRHPHDDGEREYAGHAPAGVGAALVVQAGVEQADQAVRPRSLDGRWRRPACPDNRPQSSISRASNATVTDIKPVLPHGEPALLHGGDRGAARMLFPDAPQPFVDLSTGINPHSYPVPTLPAELFARLPEPAALARLVAAAAAAYGAPSPDCVVAAPGTQILLPLVAALVPPGRAVILGPTYAEFRACRRARWALRGGGGGS